MTSSIIIYLSFLNCGWLLTWEVQWLYLTQELQVPAEKFTVRKPMVRLELATPQLWTEGYSHWANKLISYCWEGIAFILHHYIFNFSQLWLTSHQWSTVVLRNSLYQHSNSQPLIYKLSALAIELNSSKAIAGKELSLSCWCIASLYIYHCSIVADFSSEKYGGSTGHRNSWYQQINLQSWCWWWHSNSQPLGVLLGWEVNHNWEMINI